MGLEAFSLEGKVAVVTGASRGFGAAIAIGLAEAGADVVLAARTESALQDVAAKIEALGRTHNAGQPLARTTAGDDPQVNFRLSK